MVSEERAFLDAIAANPTDDARRAAYAAWLVAHEDERGVLLQLELQLLAMDPDVVERPELERRHSVMRRRFSKEWLDAIRRPQLSMKEDGCFESGAAFPRLHTDIQDTECDSWKQLQDVIEDAAAHRRVELNLFQAIRDRDERGYVVTLPSSIAKLTSLRSLEVGGTEISRIPPEIGEMKNLTSLGAYMAYRLHWYPYELTRCPRLQRSMMSTRTLYGCYSHRRPFPSLAPPPPSDRSAPTRACSVCRQPFVDHRAYRFWISRRLTSVDVSPLLVNACSMACIQRLPAPTDGYVPAPHRGGPDLVQPPIGMSRAPTLPEMREVREVREVREAREVRKAAVVAPTVEWEPSDIAAAPEAVDENEATDDDLN